MPPVPLASAWPVSALLLVFLTSCTTFPQLDAAISDAAKQAEQPELVDHRSIIGQATQTNLAPETEADLQARAGALQARSQALTAPVISDAEMQELDASATELKSEAERVAPES